jgi:hypothetical protein
VNATPTDAWSTAWARPRFRSELVLSLVVVAAALASLSAFVDWVEQRPGVAFEDPVLAMLPPTDVDGITFSLIYAGIAVSLLVLARRPVRLVTTLQAYTVLVLVRMLLMSVLPLDPPARIIPLRDPLVEMFGPGRALTRDLFFSGHTSTMFLLALAAPHRALRHVLFVFTVGVGFGTMLQHTHYAVDVFAAPFFAYGCWAGVERFHARRGRPTPGIVSPRR